MNRLELSSLYQLTVTRFKLTLREPEAIFWIFVFPILLALGLGIAFRNRPADVLPVGATTPQLVQALAADKGLKATEMDEAAGTRALATGSIVLLAIESGDGVVYRYDDTNPDARIGAHDRRPRDPDCGGAARSGCRPRINWCTRPARATSTLLCRGCWG